MEPIAFPDNPELQSRYENMIKDFEAVFKQCVEIIKDRGKRYKVVWDTYKLERLLNNVDEKRDRIGVVENDDLLECTCDLINYAVEHYRKKAGLVKI